MATALDVQAPGNRATVVVADDVRVPPSVMDLGSFRRWAHSGDFPRRGRIDFIREDIWVDLNMEQLFTHNLVKTEIVTVMNGLVRSGNRGYFFSDGVRFSNAGADISVEPDALYVSFETLQAGRAKLVSGTHEGFLEIDGSPDWIVEVVSEWSVRKDTAVLPDAYWRAGVQEYWIVDARREKLTFRVLQRSDSGFVEVAESDGWLFSAIFGRKFRLMQEADALGNPRYRLQTGEETIEPRGE